MDFLLCSQPPPGCQLLGEHIMSVLSLVYTWLLAQSLAHSKTPLSGWADEWMNGQAGFQSPVGMSTSDSTYISETTFGSQDAGGWREGLAEVEQSLSSSVSGLNTTYIVTPSPGTTCHGMVISWAVPGSSRCPGGECRDCIGGTNDNNHPCTTNSPFSGQQAYQGAGHHGAAGIWSRNRKETSKERK